MGRFIRAGLTAATLGGLLLLGPDPAETAAAVRACELGCTGPTETYDCYAYNKCVGGHCYSTTSNTTCACW